MQVSAPPRIRSFGKGLLLTALLCLVTMPVEYRGGAEHVHPHSSLQVWTEAATGSLDHHHAGSVRHGLPAFDHHHFVEQPSDDALRSPAGDLETPSLTTVTVTQKDVPLMIVGTAELPIFLVSARLSRSRAANEWFMGLNPAPTPPPPRLVATIEQLSA